MTCDTTYKHYFAGHLVAVRIVPGPDDRPDGREERAPKLFVVHYDPEMDDLDRSRIAWGAAETLAPDSLRQISAAVEKDRAIEVLRFAEPSPAEDAKERPYSALLEMATGRTEDPPMTVSHTGPNGETHA